MTFFYDLNKRLADLAKKQNLAESAEPMAERASGDYSAKKAAAGKDIGRPGKMFSKIAKSAGKAYGSKESGERVAGAVLKKLRAKEDVAQEGNAFSGAVAKAKADGVQPGEKIRVGGKEYPVKEEGGMPMTAKQKSFAKLAPPTDKITFADKIAGAKKEVDEMLGDVAAEAIKKAVKKSEPRSKGTAFDPEVLKTMTSTDPHPRYDVKDTGYSKRYTRKVQDEPADDAEVSTEPKKKGRPKGPDKGPERTTKGAWKHKGGRKEKTEEDLDTDGVMMTRPSNMSSEDIDIKDRGEYDQEGDMAKDQLHTLTKAANELSAILDDEQNLPEWIQSKITKALDYIKTANDYMDQERHDAEPVSEKAVSKKQQKFMGMVHAAQKGEKPASKTVAKVAKEMPKKAAKDFAATKHKGLPEKVKEADAEPKEKKSSGGYNFGGGVYESLNRQFAQALTEGMNVSVNMSTGDDGQARKSITVTAEGEEAEALAQLLKMAGLGSHDGAEACSSCNESPCGCAEQVDENSPDWPTNTETSDDALQYSGGLNKPKSTGQTTVPVIASQLRRQVSMEEGVTLERSLFKLYQNYKAQ
jgi:hypothetical protein